MMRDADNVLEVNSLLYRKPVAPDLGTGVVVTFRVNRDEHYEALVHDGWTKETTRVASAESYVDALKKVIAAWRRTRKTLAQTTEEN